MKKYKGVSIVICCYNSINRIKPTLIHLSKQVVPKVVHWEIIVIDNNSNDDTAEYANKLWQTLDCDVPFRIISEAEPGLSYARKKGISSAAYEYILFCDDDNWLSPSYVKTVFNIMESDSTIGLAGGWCDPVTEQNLPSWLIKYPTFFAIGKLYQKTGVADNYLFGAGLVLRHSAFKKLNEINFSFLLTDRKGTALSSGGDVELCYAIKLIGYKLWYDERLYFKHYIPPERLSSRYYIKLRKAIIKSDLILSSYRDVLNNDKKKKIYRLLVLIKFIVKLPFIGYLYFFEDKNKAIINCYYYYCSFVYFEKYNYAWKKINEWKQIV